MTTIGKDIRFNPTTGASWPAHYVASVLVSYEDREQEASQTILEECHKRLNEADADLFGEREEKWEDLGYAYILTVSQKIQNEEAV